MATTRGSFCGITFSCMAHNSMMSIELVVAKKMEKYGMRMDA